MGQIGLPKGSLSIGAVWHEERLLKGGYALELGSKAARSTVDIDLKAQRVLASADGDQNQIVREMLQNAVSLGDWFEFVVGPASRDLLRRSPLSSRSWKQSCAGTG